MQVAAAMPKPLGTKAQRRWLLTVLFIIGASVSMMGPTQALSGLVSRSLDGFFMLPNLVGYEMSAPVEKRAVATQVPAAAAAREDYASEFAGRECDGGCPSAVTDGSAMSAPDDLPESADSWERQRSSETTGLSGSGVGGSGGVLRGRAGRRASTNPALGAGSSGPTTGFPLGDVTSSESSSAASAEGLLYDPSGSGTSLSSLEDLDLMQVLALPPLPSGAAVPESDHGLSPTDRTLANDAEVGTLPSIGAFSSSDATARSLTQDRDEVSDRAVADAVAKTIEAILPTTSPHVLDPDLTVSIEEFAAVSALTAPQERRQDASIPLDSLVDTQIGDERRTDSAVGRKGAALLKVPEPSLLLLFGSAGLIYSLRRYRPRWA